jgi:YVTN family beta-propeller protein
MITKQQTIRISLSILAALALGAFSMPLMAAPKMKLRPVVIQTNYAADFISIIDPNTNKVIGEISGIELNHGAAIAPDGSKIYISDENTESLDFVDAKTLQVTKRLPLTGHPNNVTIAKDGRKVYVAITGEKAGLDIIDTTSQEVIKHIQTGANGHNPYITPDGKYVLAGSIQGKNISVIDTKTQEVAWTITLDLGIRPMAMSVNPDGSTKWIFAQLTGYNGFAVIDFATHKEINRIKNPDLPPGHENVPPGNEPSHGIAVTKDQKTLLVNSRINGALYSYSLPDLKPQRTAFLTGKGAGWLTISPDGKQAYVANAVTDDVSVVDIATMKETTVIPVGSVPKRNTSGYLQ